MSVRPSAQHNGVSLDKSGDDPKALVSGMSSQTRKSNVSHIPMLLERPPVPSFYERMMNTPAGATQGWSPPPGVSRWEFYCREILLGVTIACAQIPESMAFAFMAHIKPPVALHAAWMVGLICSTFNGRPGMVNGATGAFAAIIGNFVTDKGAGNNGEGIEQLFPSVMLAGVFMLFGAFFNLSKFILMLPAPVMIGFCNGLAIVIGLAQLHPFQVSDTEEESEDAHRRLAGGGGVGGAWKTGPELYWMLLICFTSMGIMEFVPKVQQQLTRWATPQPGANGESAPAKKFDIRQILVVFKVIPSSLFAILSAVFIEFAIVEPLGYKTNTIRDVSEFTDETAYPVPFFVDHVSTAEYDLSKIITGDGPWKVLQQAILLMVVGTIEELLTSEVVESFVRTPSDGDRTVCAMGCANLLCGFMGTMGGNAMIGLSTVNTLNGGRGRVGPVIAAFGILVCTAGAYPLLNYIPIAALSGIMIVVVLHTFKWFSLKMLLASFMPQWMREKLNWGGKKIPRYEVFVIFIVTVLSNWPSGTNIAYAVLCGTAICGLVYAWESGKQMEIRVSEVNGTRYYDIDGPLFFASANRLLKILDGTDGADKVVVRLGYTSVMDYSAIDVIHKVTKNYHEKNKDIIFESLNASSVKIIEKAKKFADSIKYVEKDVKYVEKRISDENIPGLGDSYRDIAGMHDASLHSGNHSHNGAVHTRDVHLEVGNGHTENGHGNDTFTSVNPAPENDTREDPKRIPVASSGNGTGTCRCFVLG